jgi:hypothetical protein
MPTPQNWPVFAPPQWPAFTPPLTLSIKVQPKRSTSDDSKTASRDPAAVRAPHPDIWRLWLSPMPSPGSYRAEVSRLFRRARKLQIRSDLRPTPWLTKQSEANRSPRIPGRWGVFSVPIVGRAFEPPQEFENCPNPTARTAALCTNKRRHETTFAPWCKVRWPETGCAVPNYNEGGRTWRRPI